ncbi:F-box protein [Cardamine amara subsp. amara]|uniref:F-box protein n=1 Tax=Cardamine amara subsp. amara TaxID=228776 RepID=A0ABD1BAA9_CARAN
MSEHDKGLSKIKREICYESAWLSRWTRSSRDAKCSKEINLPGDGQQLKESTKLKGKMLSGVLDLFPNLDSAVQIIPDMNKEPPIVADREDSIDEDEGATSRSATQSKNVELYLNNYTNTNLCKRIWLDPETNSTSEVKRLKTNASDYSGNETKSMMVVEEGPSMEKVNYYFHKIFGINKPGSRSNQNSSTSQGKKNLNVGKGGEDVNPWIQRWCKKKIAETHEPRGGQEVNPKDTALEKKFPSIAAMALMGRALRGLNPTGCRKTNTLFVWDAQDLR